MITQSGADRHVSTAVWRLSVLGAAVAGGIVACVLLGMAAEAGDLLRQAEQAYLRGQYAEAVRLASVSLSQDGPSATAHRLRAAAYNALRQFDRAITDLDQWIELDPEAAGAYQTRGETHFKAGHFTASLADFDRFLSLRPDQKPYHWQRGISCYYAGQYQKGVEQFELHRTVNPQDVENAIWHFLCKAKLVGVTGAQAALIGITSDSRPWAMPVYRLYQGKATVRQVLADAQRTAQTPEQRHSNLFYTHFYVALYNEVTGQTDRAREHMRIAVEKYPTPHYMGEVARVALNCS